MYKLGIVGFGVVGKSMLSFLRKHQEAYQVAVEDELHMQEVEQTFGAIEVWDKRVLGSDEKELLQAYGATAVDSAAVDLLHFMQRQDFIVVSPGVDLAPYPHLRHKVLCELDFFSTFFKKPVVAITGSVGKTTITRLLGMLSSALPVAPLNPLVLARSFHLPPGKDRFRVTVGGNVGIGMLDLVSLQDDLDAAVVELSSFQLDLNNAFAPAIAIWSNFYPNHLDRHQTLENYFKAKFNVMRLQQTNDVAIIGWEVFNGCGAALLDEQLGRLRSQVFITSSHRLDEDDIKRVAREDFYLLYSEKGAVIFEMYKQKYCLQRLTLVENVQLPDITFLANWLQVIAALYAMGLDVSQLPAALASLSADALRNSLAHRMRLCATIRGVDFYDDSKSTIVQSTIAAVQRLAAGNRPITLIVGGLGKGADRSWLMQALACIPQVKRIISFGPESHVFAGATAFGTLEEVIGYINREMAAGDVVLFSPSGASYDFFKNFEHRGQVFEQLVRKLAP